VGHERPMLSPRRDHVTESWGGNHRRLLADPHCADGCCQEPPSFARAYSIGIGGSASSRSGQELARY
jgi:hypothetical protein